MIKKSKAAMSMVLSYTRALSAMYQHMHWRTSGENYYGDHLLFDRLYGETNGELDGIAEKTVGLFNDSDAIGPNSDLGATTGILKNLVTDSDSPESYAEIALDAEKGFQELISETIKSLEAEDELSNGVDNMLQGIADLHESHLYLLQQRLGKKANVLVGLYKVAYNLDKKALYNEAAEIEKVMESLANRVGLKIEDMIALADHFDEVGDRKLADHFDSMVKNAEDDGDWTWQEPDKILAEELKGLILKVDDIIREFDEKIEFRREFKDTELANNASSILQNCRNDLSQVFRDTQRARKLANYVTKNAKSQKEQRPPKKWWDKMEKEIKESSPDYSEERVAKTIGDIWFNDLTEKRRKEISNRDRK